MAKKKIKKTEPKLVKPEVVSKNGDTASLEAVTEIPSDNTRIIFLENRLVKLNDRIDRIVAAISKAKSIKGM